MYKIVYTKNALEDLKSLEIRIAKRITEKIHFFANQQNLLSFSKKLQNFASNRYQFRVGDYRVIFRIGHGRIQVLLILRIKHRKDVYNL